MSFCNVRDQDALSTEAADTVIDRTSAVNDLQSFRNCRMSFCEQVWSDREDAWSKFVAIEVIVDGSM